MARLNISLPDEIHELAERWRGRVNLSAVCAEALRLELAAAEGHRLPPLALQSYERPGPLERALAERFGLSAAIVREPESARSLRDLLGQATAEFLERELVDGATLSVAGGRQMWCVVRHLSPRRLRLRLFALGFGQHDSEVLHAHANTLVTLLWLLYGPRSTAHLVGSRAAHHAWRERTQMSPTHFLVASVGRFEAGCPLSGVLGPEATDELSKAGAAFDIAYQFFNRERRAVLAPSVQASVPSVEDLKDLTARRDARVVIVGGGSDKVEALQLALNHSLCDSIVTDRATAREILDG